MRYAQPTPSLRRPSRIIAKSLVVCLFLFTTHSVLCEVLAADFTGPVVSVLDGDTIEVLHSNKAERTRLHGIDYPEKNRTFEILVSIEFVGGNTTPQLVQQA
jgi:endonuclease YncB( thermonuclease family)